MKPMRRKWFIRTIKPFFPLAHPEVTFPRHTMDEFKLNFGFLDMEKHNLGHEDLKAELKRQIYNPKEKSSKGKINII